MRGIREFKVFLASPSDAEAERGAVHTAADKVNAFLQILKRDAHVTIRGWESVSSGAHAGGPQGRIDEQCGPTESDLVLGVFKKRFGEPKINGKTPTEHEIRSAFESWKRGGRPQVALYFSSQPRPSNTEEYNGP